MPIVKANQSLGERPVVFALYGDPGGAKTSIANTCEAPLLLDFDRGAQRSYGRKDVLVMNSWDDVLADERAGAFKGYKTLIIDTAKAALDDFLMVWVKQQDYKIANNPLKAYGAIGDAFKTFVNARRAEGMDIFIIAHAKKDEDTKRQIPDVTGQSYQLIMRIADQVGYLTMINNVRTIGFNPTDLTVGKNVAGLDPIQVPAKGSPEFEKFGAGLIQAVKTAILSMDDSQREALEKSAKYQEQLETIDTPDDLTELTNVVNELPQHLALPLRKLISEKAKEKGWRANGDTKKFEVIPSSEEGEAANNAENKEATPAVAPASPQGSTNEQPAAKISPFKKKYETAEEIEKVLEDTVTIQDTSNLYYINADLIEQHPELKVKFTDRKNAIYDQKPSSTPPAGTEQTASIKKAKAAKPKKETQKEAQAQKQSLEWFQERVGKLVWQQAGPEVTSEPYTGINELEDGSYPEWMFGLQNEGYTFRDATEAEIAADAAEREKEASHAN